MRFVKYSIVIKSVQWRAYYVNAGAVEDGLEWFWNIAIR